MDLSNWINLGLLIVSVIATGVTLGSTAVARSAQKEANEIQKRLLDVERRRDTLFEQLERTPNLSATRVWLEGSGKLFTVEIAITNLSRHAVHIIAVAVRNTDSDSLLAVGGLNKLVQSAEQIDALLGAEATPSHAKIETDAGDHFVTTQRSAVDLLSDASQISLYFRYAPTGDTIYSFGYQTEDVHSVVKAHHLERHRRVLFNPSKPSVTINPDVPKIED